MPDMADPSSHPSQLSLEPTDSFLDSWKLSSPTLTSVYIAVMTTLFSYHLTAILFDLLQGFNRRNETTASAMQSRLLATVPAPLDLLSAVFREDSIDRTRFPNLPNGNLPRNNANVSIFKLASLCLLVISSPISHISAIMFTVEYRQVIPMERTTFRGAGLGFGSNLSNDEVMQFGRCASPELKVPPHHKSLIEFFSCRSRTDHHEQRASTGSIATVEVELHNDGSVVIREISPVVGKTSFSTVSVTEKINATVATTSGTRRITHAFTVESAKQLLQVGISAYNFSSDIVTVEKAQEFTLNGFPLVSQRAIRRNGGSLDVRFFAPFRAMHRRVKLIPNQDMKILSKGDTFEKALNLPVLERRRRVLNEAPLGLAVAVLFCIRVFLKFVLRNNVEAGMASALRSFVGGPLLWTDNEVTYNHTCSIGKDVVHGIAQPYLREVEELGDSVIDRPETELKSSLDQCETPSTSSVSWD